MIDIGNIVSHIFPGLNPQAGLIFFLLIFTRFLVMTNVMPIFGAQLLPGIVRVALSALLSATVFLPLMDQAHVVIHLSMFLLVILFIKEALLGFILGFLASLIFYVYELFGELVDLARAASMSKLLVPELKHQSSPMGTLFFQLALVVLISSGFHRDIIKAAYESFVIFPATSAEAPFLRGNFFAESFQIMDTLFETAFRFALPIILICFLIDLAFGLMNRVAPQINAYFLSLPAKMVGGLLMLFFVIPFLLEDFSSHYQNITRFFYLFLKRS